MTNYFTPKEKEMILSAIENAERRTSGEIRVHIEDRLADDPLDRAVLVFEKLGMHKTAERNGVLIYLATGARKFAILGDAGINQKVSPQFWDEVKEKMNVLFMEGLMAEGLQAGIFAIGEKLTLLFPFESSDQNELSNDISFTQF